ncbi:hypothetical protein FBU30_001685 [Linnemannia zychae]|nr:hypothetical protein FBU30_001685 [Linnemannia zychae]
MAERTHFVHTGCEAWSRRFARHLVLEDDLVKASNNINVFKRKWEKYAFLRSLERYVTDDMKPRWMFAYRKDTSYERMNINNLIKSYRNYIKKRFLLIASRRHADTVIYNLYRLVLPAYELKSVTSDIGAGRMFLR